MSLVDYKINDGLMTIYLNGRIDSSNAADVEAELQDIRGAESYKEIHFDAEQLEYISSAGLRVILRTRKQEPSLQIVNASSEVYEILEMTGFTEMLPVSKAYRKMSVDGCEVIGQGANGKVYRIDPDTIVKVYFNSDALPDIHRERELARTAFVLGIPTAIPYDVVKVDDSYGSVFELLNAKSFAKLINADPDGLDHYIDLFIDLLQKIHKTEVKPKDMPDMKKVVLDWAAFVQEYLPSYTAEKLYDMVEAVPTDYHMMHGDYHIKNVMMQDGEVLLIDMDTLCYGHPVFELASMFNAFEGFSELDHSQSMAFLGISHDTSVEIWEKSLQRYLGTDDEDRIRDVENKAKIIGYTRMMRRRIRRNGFDTEQGRKEIETYKQHIIELVEKVDKLTF